ncbi:hypothetical protein Nepgr_023989 [Nepenthes gracilis]|uniref:Uncharacterized protein n=1 Tax=Nepenthes gracilis TaxID=150966 RepID=A0AAD3T5C4_NEPGR|nr:hypothetical protein Nepgr_023989 [Nepenthes gracilis]
MERGSFRVIELMPMASPRSLMAPQAHDKFPFEAGSAPLVCCQIVVFAEAGLLAVLLKGWAPTTGAVWMTAEDALSEVGLSVDVVLIDAGVWQLISPCLAELAGVPLCWWSVVINSVREGWYKADMLLELPLPPQWLIAAFLSCCWSKGSMQLPFALPQFLGPGCAACICC